MEPCEHGRCYIYETAGAIADELDGLRAQLKERDAIIDEAMRLLDLACPKPRSDWGGFFADRDWKMALRRIRARIEEARR